MRGRVRITFNNFDINAMTLRSELVFRVFNHPGDFHYLVVLTIASTQYIQRTLKAHSSVQENQWCK